MAKTVVFGAGGFIGKALTPLLRDFSSPSSSDVDLCNPVSVRIIHEKISGGITVIMLAAYTPEKGNVRDTTIKNIIMARNVLEVIKHQEINHFVYVSSDAVYPMVDGVITEQTPTVPDTLYGYMHAIREQYFREFIAPEKLTIIRPCAVYGRGDTHNSYGINRFLKEKNERGIVSLFGEGEEYRDAIHVDDLAKIINYAAKDKICGTFNAVSGKSYTFKQMAEMIGGKIHYLPRKQPITHRHFDNFSLITKFFGPKTIDMGIKSIL